VRSILITGVSSGLGRALAARAHAAGWRVFGTTRREGTAVEHGFPSGITLLRLELRFPQAPRTFAERFIAEHGVPDVLVNNAAQAAYGPVELMDADALRQLFQVNVFSAVELTTAFLPGMRERGSGTIVNVTSIGGRTIFPFFTTYNATKHALEGFSEGLWHELKPFGIRVKAIEPGYVETPIYDVMSSAHRSYGAYGPAVEAMDAFARGVKRWTSPEAAAEQVLAAIEDTSGRLRYPVAAYARSLLAARALLGSELFIKVMHARWRRPDR